MSMRYVLRVIALVAGGLSNSAAGEVLQGSTPSVTSPHRTIVAKPLARALSDSGSPVIVNGQEADSLLYPASFQADTGERICTWFLVGPQALVGAAHCVAGLRPEDALAAVDLPIAGKTYTASCAIPTNYWKDKSQDWAACRIATPVPVPGATIGPVVGFEVLATDLHSLVERPKVEISGFGCKVPGGPSVDVYRIGKAKVAALPPHVRIPGAPRRTPNAIKVEQSPALLCKGDSGGPAFLYRSDRDRVHRVVVGVNSATALDAGRSYLASVSTPTANAFFTTWAKEQQVLICGLHKQAQNCRPF